MRLIAFVLLFAGHHALSQGWTQLPNFPGMARDDASGFAVGDVVYVGTGRGVDYSLRTDWYAFDALAEEWTAIAPMPTTGRQYCTAFADGQYGYVFGGVDATGPLNELWRYDPMTDTWEQRTSLPGPGRSASVAFHGGLICTGMMAGGIPTDEVWSYLVETDSWSQLASVPGGPRHRASGSGVYGWILGGANAAFEALSDAYSYYAPTDTWYPMPDMPGPRYGADASNNVMVGGASSVDEYHDGTWMFHGTSGWTIEAAFPGGPRRGGVMATNQQTGPLSGHIFYGTGVDLIERKNDWWRFDYDHVGIEEQRSRSIKCYPNPTNGQIRINLSGLANKLHYNILDIAGRSIMSGTLSADALLDVSEHEPGRYIVVIESEGIPYRSNFTLIP